MPAPILGVRGDHSVGGDGGQPQPARGGQCLVAPPAGPKLGVEILGTAEAECLLEKVDIAGEQDEAFSVVGEQSGQRDGPEGATAAPRCPFSPVDRCNSAAQCPPAALVHRERHHLLAIRHQMGAEYGAHAHRITGALELDRSVDPIGVGAGERSEATLGGRLGQYLRAGDAEAEGEVGVGVEVSEHSIKA